MNFSINIMFKFGPFVSLERKATEIWMKDYNICIHHNLMLHLVLIFLYIVWFLVYYVVVLGGNNNRIDIWMDQNVSKLVNTNNTLLCYLIRATERMDGIGRFNWLRPILWWRLPSDDQRYRLLCSFLLILVVVITSMMFTFFWNPN